MGTFAECQYCFQTYHSLTGMVYVCVFVFVCAYVCVLYHSFDIFVFLICESNIIGDK